jgi:hypothetical protein
MFYSATQQLDNHLPTSTTLSPFSLTAVVEKRIFTPAPERPQFGTFKTPDV